MEASAKRSAERTFECVACRCVCEYFLADYSFRNLVTLKGLFFKAVRV